MLHACNHRGGINRPRNAFSICVLPGAACRIDVRDSATYLRSADQIYVRRNVSRPVRQFLFGEFLCRDAWLICARNSLRRQRGSCLAMLRRQAIVFWLRNFPWNFSFPSNKQIVDSQIVRRVHTYRMYSCGIYRWISCALNTISSEIATDFLFRIGPSQCLFALYSSCGKFVCDVYRLGTIYRFVFASIACDRINRSTGRHGAHGFVMRKRNEKSSRSDASQWIVTRSTLRVFFCCSICKI